MHNFIIGFLFQNQMDEWVKKEYLQDSAINKLRASFINKKPYPNFALEDFFDKAKLNKIKNEIKKEKFERHDKDLFSLDNTQELKCSNSGIVKNFYDFFSSRKFLNFIMQLTGQKNLKSIWARRKD